MIHVKHSPEREDVFYRGNHPPRTREAEQSHRTTSLVAEFRSWLRSLGRFAHSVTGFCFGTGRSIEPFDWVARTSSRKRCRNCAGVAGRRRRIFGSGHSTKLAHSVTGVSFYIGRRYRAFGSGHSTISLLGSRNVSRETYQSFEAIFLAPDRTSSVTSTNLPSRQSKKRAPGSAARFLAGRRYR